MTPVTGAILISARSADSARDPSLLVSTETAQAYIVSERLGTRHGYITVRK